MGSAMTKRYATFTTVSVFKHRYVVEMKEGDTLENLADLVTCEELEEFSQKHVDELIVDSYIVSEEEMLKLFRQDNAYLNSWSDEYVLSWVKRLEEKFK
jgi:hypothetical protein